MTKINDELSKMQTQCSVMDGYIDVWDERIPQLDKDDVKLLEMKVASSIREFFAIQQRVKHVKDSIKPHPMGCTCPDCSDAGGYAWIDGEITFKGKR